ncbi:VanZ family protein [Streptomyces sp. NPDC090026]|uniref:VanZ family protein n=1 Tax=Streptomyces sp. NPDC090026 TaxID=3365923 RepID=UPI00381C1BAF
MLQAVLHDRLTFLIALTFVGLAVGVATFVYARTKGASGPWWGLTGASAVLVLGATVFFPTRSGGANGWCTINKDLWEPMVTEQGVLNAALFVPLGFFGVLATRRVVPVVAAGAVGSMLIEVGQSLIPWTGGACDSGDVQMNSLGTVLGAACGWMVGRAKGASLTAGARRTGRNTAGAVLATALIFGLFVQPQVVDGTGLRTAVEDERVTAESAIREAFGDRYAISAVQLSPGIDGAPGSLQVTFEEPLTAMLTWPEADYLSVQLESSSEPGPVSFAVGGAANPRSKAEAERIATAYADAHYPWAAEAQHRQTTSMGEFGWMTSWRWAKGGVLMPRALDVQLNTAGRVSQLVVNSGPDVLEDLPAETVSRSQAEDEVREKIKPAIARVGAVTKKAYRVRGEWRAVWLVRVVPDGGPAETMSVDAASGEVANGTPLG